MNIPYYPKFKPLEISDWPVFDEAFQRNPPEISEFTFTNLYSWRRAYRFTVSLSDDFLILCSESDKGKEFFPPIGAGNAKPIIEKVLTTHPLFLSAFRSKCELFLTTTVSLR